MNFKAGTSFSFSSIRIIVLGSDPSKWLFTNRKVSMFLVCRSDNISESRLSSLSFGEIMLLLSPRVCSSIPFRSGPCSRITTWSSNLVPIFPVNIVNWRHVISLQKHVVQISRAKKGKVLPVEVIRFSCFQAIAISSGELLDKFSEKLDELRQPSRHFLFVEIFKLKVKWTDLFVYRV